jgi:Ca2+-binding RTX toxin-like protein
MTTTPTEWSGEVVFENAPDAVGARVTALSDGTFVLAWANETGDIFAKHLDEMGSFTGGNFLADVSAGTADPLGTPIVTEQTNGAVVVNYSLLAGDTPIDRDIFWAQANSDFSSTSLPFGTETSGSDEILLDSVAHGETGADDPAGGALLYDFSNGVNDNLVVRFTDSVGNQASNQIFIDPSTDRTESDGAMASLHTGFVAVAYGSFKNNNTGPDDRDIRLKVYSPDGTQVPGGDVIVSDSNKIASFPDVTELTDGNFVVAWQQAGGIAFRRYSGNGFALDASPVVIPDTSGGFVPKITPLNDHGFMIAWTNINGTESDGSPNLDIYLQRFDASGQEVGTTIHLDEAGDQGLFDMNIATLADGRVVLTYQTETGDATDQTELAYRIFDPREANILGTNHNDNIVGRLEASTIQGFDGDDKLAGMSNGDNLSGGAGNDVLIGRLGDDSMAGGAGNDQLLAGVGNDHLRGNLGSDALTGSTGADVFIYKSIAESTVAATGRDTILDFKHVQHDQIDLHVIDANSNSTGNQKFDFIGDHAFGHHAGELRVTHSNGDTFVNGDVNGDGKADFSIQLHGNVNLQETDFLL